MATPFQRKKNHDANANSWERHFGKLMTPFELFIGHSASSGILLIICTLAALLVANSPLAAHYHAFLQQHVVIDFAFFKLDMSVHHWINDGLMCVFFFLVGIEIKHEIMVGELSSWRKALLPIVAAVGGMALPALIFTYCNFGDVGIVGWAIPMATDIAFAIAVMILLGSRVPTVLMTILVALAIVDDLGAVLIIAIFYTENIAVNALLLAALTFAIMLLLNRVGVRRLWIYFIFALALWIFMLSSGVHATIAGVLAALTVPARSLYNPLEFSRDARKLLDRFDIYREREKNFLESDALNGVLHTLNCGINQAQTPLQRMEHALQAPVYFFVIPLFAFFNAGVSIDFGDIGASLQRGVALGIILGLPLGKLFGVLASVWFCNKMKWLQLPEGINFTHIIGMGLLAGIGFTMSIFISELAFNNEQLLLRDAKIAVLIASIIASVGGYLWLRFFAKNDKNNLSNQ